jgi:hypothetical protein
MIIHANVGNKPKIRIIKLTKVEIKNKDWLIIIAVFIVTLAPLIIGFFDWGKKNYFLIVFFAGFLPIYATHTTSLGLRFRNKKFSVLWISMILLNGLLYHKVINVWIAMVVSYAFYNLLRLLFLKLSKQDPIPLFIGPGTSLNFNNIENRMENKRDGLFSIISFFCGLLLTLTLVILK